jgi:hypothetical protein
MRIGKKLSPPPSDPLPQRGEAKEGNLIYEMTLLGFFASRLSPFSPCRPQELLWF